MKIQPVKIRFQNKVYEVSFKGINNDFELKTFDSKPDFEEFASLNETKII